MALGNGVPSMPQEVWEKFKAFLDSGKTGSITLDVKQGHVLAWKITEAGRLGVDKTKEVCID